METVSERYSLALETSRKDGYGQVYEFFASLRIAINTCTLLGFPILTLESELDVKLCNRYGTQ